MATCKRCGGTGQEPERLTPEKRERNYRIYVLAKDGAKYQDLARQFGISAGRVHQIATRVAGAHGFRTDWRKRRRGVMERIQESENLKDFPSAQAIADHFKCKRGTVVCALQLHPLYPELKQTWKQDRGDNGSL